MSTRAINTTVLKPVAGSAERFFQWSLYVLLVVGFTALMGTNKLDPPSLALVIPALLLRGYLLLMRKSFVISERWTSFLTILYFAFYAADYFYFSQSFMDATVHMVLFSLVIKIFSVHRERDLVYLAVLAFLMVLAAAVLTVDTVFLLAFSFFILVAIATFISMEMRRSERDSLAAGIPPQHDVKFHGSLAGMSVILGVMTLAGSALIFFILPRMSSAGYLRNFGIQGAITSGFSQDVRLGGIGQIQQSSAVVMHVQVQYGKLPPDAKWRGIALANFDGHRWWNNPDPPNYRGLNNAPLDLTQLANSSLYSGMTPPPRLPSLSYRVVMEPVGLDVFFLAPVPLKINGDYHVIEISPDGSVFNSHPATGESENPQAIGAYSADADTRDPESFVRDSNSRNYPERVSLLYLQLPRLDSRIPALARRITASSGSNYVRAKAIEEYLQTNFSYTLQLPGLTEPDPLSYFLFERKKGHCEYFASSMAIMLRTLGIPARVVNGFRGGEYNDLTGSYIVREKDAHSWVEAYFPEYGWATFDPTPSVPATGEAGGLSRMALYLDAMREMWREWVINYDFSHQMRLSAELGTRTGNAQSSFRLWLWSRYRQMVARVNDGQRRLERLSPTDMVVCCVVLFLLLAVPLTIKAWRSVRRKSVSRNPKLAPRTTASFWYLRMLKTMARRGVRKEPTQTPAEFTSSIADLQMRMEVETFTHHYERARFAESVEDAQRLPELYEELAGHK